MSMGIPRLVNQDPRPVYYYQSWEILWVMYVVRTAPTTKCAASFPAFS